MNGYLSERREPEKEIPPVNIHQTHPHPANLWVTFAQHKPKLKQSSACVGRQRLHTAQAADPE